MEKLYIATREEFLALIDEGVSNRYYEEADHGISWQTDQVRNWRRSATNAVEALLQS